MVRIYINIYIGILILMNMIFYLLATTQYFSLLRRRTGILNCLYRLLQLKDGKCSFFCQMVYHLLTRIIDGLHIRCLNGQLARLCSLFISQNRIVLLIDFHIRTYVTKVWCIHRNRYIVARNAFSVK
jgi:hypothetical protein